MLEDNNNKKDIEVVEGIGNLDISPVFDNITSAKPKMQDEKPKNIVIPQVKKSEEKDEKESENNSDSVENKDIDTSEDSEETFDDLSNTVEEDSETSDDEQIEFDDIAFEDVDLDDDIDEADD